MTTERERPVSKPLTLPDGLLTITIKINPGAKTHTVEFDKPELIFNGPLRRAIHAIPFAARKARGDLRRAEKAKERKEDAA